jgi:hypothetical protein
MFAPHGSIVPTLMYPVSIPTPLEGSRFEAGDHVAGFDDVAHLDERIDVLGHVDLLTGMVAVEEQVLDAAVSVRRRVVGAPARLGRRARDARLSDREDRAATLGVEVDALIGALRDQSLRVPERVHVPGGRREALVPRHCERIHVWPERVECVLSDLAVHGEVARLLEPLDVRDVLLRVRIGDPGEQLLREPCSRCSSLARLDVLALHAGFDDPLQLDGCNRLARCTSSLRRTPP